MTQDLPTRLDDLSVDELNQLATVIVGLKEAGYLMQGQGFDVRFSLVPGLPVTMRLNYHMPRPGPLPALVPESVAQASDDDLQVHLFGSMPAEGPTAAEIDAAVTAACDKVLPTLVQALDEPEPAPAPAGLPARWTDDEDARLVTEVANRMVIDRMTKGAAIAEVAAMLGRPKDGSEYRLNTLDALRAAEPTAGPIAPTLSPIAATLSPIEQHLLDMPTKGGWTLEHDLDLLQLSDNGWTIPEIATELGKDGKAVAERFDLLTGFDRETKTRKWKRADLLAAAREWTAKTKPAAAAE